MSEFSELLGQTLSGFTLDKNGDQLELRTAEGGKYLMYHSQDCCESVTIDDINGDLADLLGSPILLAEEVTSAKNPEGVEMEYQDSFTWTFYKLGTAYHTVVMRWYGSSNGYYSESVSFEKR